MKVAESATADRVARAAPGSRGVVAFDVDGVLLRPLFLFQISRRMGLLVWLRVLFLGSLYKFGLISVKAAVESAYSTQRGARVRDLLALACDLRYTSGALEVFDVLKQAGYLIVLVSAGVPQNVVEEIAASLGADDAWGVLLEEEDGVLTGRLLGDRHTVHGKRLGLERLIRNRGFGWNETTVVADDRSNEEIVEVAWRSVGINPEYPIRRKASFVIHTRDLREILEFFPEGYRSGITPQWFAVRHEAFRKAIHACSVVMPALAAWSKPLALWLVGSVTALFVAAELGRMIGVWVPVFSPVTWRAMRAKEARGMVLGPILFGLGIWLAIALFPAAAAAAGVLILALGDGAASLVGKALGRRRLLYNPGKTMEGSLALFAVSVAIAVFFVPFAWALLVGAVASFVESLPLGPSDNLLLPLATAGAVALSVAG